jgi:hypothetical protein
MCHEVRPRVNYFALAGSLDEMVPKRCIFKLSYFNVTFVMVCSFLCPTFLHPLPPILLGSKKIIIFTNNDWLFLPSSFLKIKIEILMPVAQYKFALQRLLLCS